MIRKVDFIIAGVQKGGTTALFDYLTEQPAIGLSSVKEVHYFDDESVDWAAPDYEAYHRQFPDDAWQRQIVGEATPIYCYWPNSLERIHAYRPDIKLVILLRDPVQRAWSHWKMEYARGAEREPFAWCIRQGRQRLFDAEPWGHHRVFSYVERGFYAEQMARIFSVFSRGQVLVLNSDDLRRDPNATLTRLMDFLGAPAPSPVKAREVHVGRTMDYGSILTEEDVAYLREIYEGDELESAELRLAGSTAPVRWLPR